MRIFLPPIVAILVVVGACALSAAAEPAANDQTPVNMSWGVKVPMRDGVKLNATVYQPDAKDALPVIFTMTPYISDTYHDRAMYFARNGYVFALVDVRGRGNSGGEFEPFANDARDGHDVVEWLARQPWCNGKVAMWGGSYAGFNQWATLKEFPPHLATIVPAAAAHPGVDFPAPHNIFVSYDIQWLTFTSGVTPNAKLFGESELLDRQVPRAIPRSHPVPEARHAGRQSVAALSKMAPSPHAGRVSRRDGPGPPRPMPELGSRS